MYVTLGLQFSFFQKPIDVLDCKLIKSKLWRNLYVLICLACFRALWKNCGRFSLHPSPFRIFFQVNRNLQMNKTSRLSQWSGNGLEWNKHPAASNFLLYSLYSTQLKWFQNFILFFFYLTNFPSLNTLWNRHDHGRLTVKNYVRFSTEDIRQTVILDCGWGKLWLVNHLTIETVATFSKYFKSTWKRKVGVLKFFRFEEHFRKTLF